MRAELIELHNRLQATMIYVTHDQVEAMTMGDKIVVMRDGKVQQIGSPLYLYNQPINKFVAGFMGSPPMNFLTVKIVEENGQVMVDEGSCKLRPAASHAALLKPYVGKEVTFGVRPEDLPVAADGVDASSGTINAKVTVVEPLGAEINIYATTKGQSLTSRVPPHHTYKIGDDIVFSPIMEKARYFDRENELAILPVKFDEQA
jgi:multiple sugar transport system ATP-binding protein